MANPKAWVTNEKKNAWGRAWKAMTDAEKKPYFTRVKQNALENERLRSEGKLIEISKEERQKKKELKDKRKEYKMGEFTTRISLSKLYNMVNDLLPKQQDVVVKMGLGGTSRFKN